MRFFNFCYYSQEVADVKSRDSLNFLHIEDKEVSSSQNLGLGIHVLADESIGSADLKNSRFTVISYSCASCFTCELKCKVNELFYHCMFFKNISDNMHCKVAQVSATRGIKIILVIC